MLTRLRPAIPLVALALTLSLAATPLVEGVAPYTLTMSPSVPVSLGSTITMTLTVSGGTRNSAYTVMIDVVKPNGTGSATVPRTVTTDSQGNGAVSQFYPDPSFTAVSGTVATDVGGVYTVIVNQTSPTNIGTVASGQFTVSSQLTVVISQPVAGTVVQRGQLANITATVSSTSGPDTLATVSANTPSGGIVILLQTGKGVYTVGYQVSTSAPMGPWIIIVQASDSQGNSGSSPPLTITITKTNLVVDSLLTYDSTSPSTSFSSGDTIYAFFRIRYFTGLYLTSGQYSVGLKNSSGVIVANLTGAYNGSFLGFYTSTGYKVSALDPSGLWSVEIGANSLDDGYGNTGPSTVIAYRFWVNLPSWPVGGVLTISSLTPSSLVLSWTPASSNVIIASYRIFQNGVLIATIPGNNTSFRVTGLESGKSYEFKVEAVDGNGNMSSRGLSQTETMPTQQSILQSFWFFIVLGIATSLGSAIAAFILFRARRGGASTAL
jgi:hypothetical protein